MALLDSELQRVRFELGYNTLSAGAEPYISYVAIFDAVVQRYLNAGAKTSSTTYVADPGEEPVLKTLTLLSATGFEAGGVVWIDVDARQESATIEEVSGSTISLVLSRPHGIPAGTSKYQVTVEGGEAIVREILADIRAVTSGMSLAGANAQNAALLTNGGGLKRVDEIEFYYSNSANVDMTGGSVFSNLRAQLKYHRDRLASALGVRNMWNSKGGGGGSLTLY